MTDATRSLPRAFVWRRLHSLMGFWLVLFLIEHLLTNSQAALMIGENGEGFIRAVNFIKNLPYLHVIEIVLLGVPFLYHGILGIRYTFQGYYNSYPRQKNRPSLSQYGRNQAYTWQRITAWILVFGVILHVWYMRFYRYPDIVNQGDRSAYFVWLHMDSGLYTVADRLDVKIYDEAMIKKSKLRFEKDLLPELKRLQKRADEEFQTGSEPIEYEQQTAQSLQTYEELVYREKYVEALESHPLGKDQVMAVADNFGTATLLMVRDAFKSVWKGILYTIFVLAACFHAFNGLWTFMISWGVVLKVRSQSQAVNFCIGTMVVIAFLGLAAIWGTYFLNLRN